MAAVLGTGGEGSRVLTINRICDPDQQGVEVERLMLFTPGPRSQQLIAHDLHIRVHPGWSAEFGFGKDLGLFCAGLTSEVRVLALEHGLDLKGRDCSVCGAKRLCRQLFNS